MPLYTPAGTVSGNSTVGGTLGVTGLLTASSGVNTPAIATPATPAASATAYTRTGPTMPASIVPSGLVMTDGGTVQTTTSTTTVANTAAATALQSFTVPANDPAAGSVYAVTGYGIYSCTGTPTLQFVFYWGGVAGTVIASVPAVTLAVGITNSPFSYSGVVNFSSTTSVFASLMLNIDTSVATDLCSTYIATPTAAVTVVSNAGSALTVGVTWGTASASNTISLTGGMVQRLA